MTDYPEKPKRGKPKRKRSENSQLSLAIGMIVAGAVVIFISMVIFIMAGPTDGGETAINSALKDGRYLDAIDLYTAEIERGRRLTENHIGRAEAYYAIGDSISAMADYNMALARDPDNPEIEYGRGLALAASNQTSAAIDAFTRAIDMATRPPAEYYLALGRVYEQRENFDAAIEQYYLYIDAAGDDADPDIAAHVESLHAR